MERSDKDSAKRKEKAIDGDSTAMRMLECTPGHRTREQMTAVVNVGEQLLAAVMVEFGLFTAANTTGNNRG